MLSENIRTHRKAKGFSQEELAIKLNVVRQTVSKWEKGQSVPDSEMLIQIAMVLDTSVSKLLGESSSPGEATEDIKTISAKLEVLNEQYAKRTENKRKLLHWASIVIIILSVVCIADRLITFGTFLRFMMPPSSGSMSTSDIPYMSTAIYMLLRMLPIPVTVLIIGGISFYKTK